MSILLCPEKDAGTVSPVPILVYDERRFSSSRWRAPGRRFGDGCPLINKTFMISQRKCYTLITGKLFLLPPVQCGCGKFIVSCSLSVLSSWEAALGGGEGYLWAQEAREMGSARRRSPGCEGKSVRKRGAVERREKSGDNCITGGTGQPEQ